MLIVHAPDRPVPGMEVPVPFAPRKIRAAFHDIDGTHSLIRKWVPVMTLVTGATARYGLCRSTPEDIAEFLRAREGEDFSEANRFAVESAGLSALTQMEWAIRMSRRVSGTSSPGNEAAIRAIWNGCECFEVPGETAEERARIEAESSLLFRAYEILLRSMCRDRNLELARQDPAGWRVPGSMEFLTRLWRSGVKNYFVTGAVVEYTPDGKPMGTMAEEIQVLGYEVGPGKLIEAFRGSTWDKKLPKNELMRALCREYGYASDELLIVGDGRSEIAAAVELGAVALSRLNPDASKAREIHRALGTNLIVDDYSPELLKEFMLEKK